MGEGAGVEGCTRSGALAGDCKTGDGGRVGMTNRGELEGMIGRELDEGCGDRGGDTTGVATT